jgi:uncharacterized protein YbjQ (UPF0145 family)
MDTSMVTTGTELAGYKIIKNVGIAEVLAYGTAVVVEKL